ncbi:MAG: dihydroorotase [candidate division WOR-3 bacterium]
MKVFKSHCQTIIIKGGKIVIPNEKVIANAGLLIQNGIIKQIKIGRESIEDKTVIELTDNEYISPGFIDMHCHLREPGFTKSETIASGTLSAICGGFCRVSCMPNTRPALDSPKLVKLVKDKAEQAGNALVSVIGAVTKGRKGKELVDMEKMVEAGVVAFSDDGSPISNPEIMREALLFSKKYKVPIINHCEVLTLSAGGMLNLGYVSKKLGVKGIPDSAESIMVLRDILLAEQTRGWVHIAHVSTAKSVKLIQWAKKQGIKVTAETCPHYLTLTDKDCLSLDTNYKVSPPLRTKQDVEAIKQGLVDGSIDVIATDHAPWHRSYKQKPWSQAKSGMIGFETAFAIGYQELVLKKYLSLERFIACLTTKPAQIINKPVQLTQGALASITIFDLSKRWLVREEDIVSKSKNSPFIGRKLKGKVTRVILNNTIFTIN